VPKAKKKASTAKVAEKIKPPEEEVKKPEKEVKRIYTREVLERSPQLSLGNFLRDLRREKPGLTTAQLEKDAKIRRKREIDRLLAMPDEEVGKIIRGGRATEVAEDLTKSKAKAIKGRKQAGLFEEPTAQEDMFRPAAPTKKEETVQEKVERYKLFPEEGEPRIEESAGKGVALQYPDYKTFLAVARKTGWTGQNIAQTTGIKNEADFLRVRNEEMQKYVEKPVRPLMERVYAEGGQPYSSNAYGPGDKGVWYTDKQGKEQFMPLEEVPSVTEEERSRLGEQPTVGRKQEPTEPVGREAVPSGEPGRVRPPLRVAGGEYLPTPQEIIPATRYTSLAQDQRLASNLMLQAFNEGKKGFMLADGAGVGKTLQQLVVAREMADKLRKPTLLITQNLQIIEGNFKRDASKFGIDLANIEFGTYDGLRVGKVGKKNYGLAIFDEAHNLKNPQAAKTQAARQVTADHILYATATPMDRPTGAEYFLSEITGQSKETIRQQLGYHIETRITHEGNEFQTPVLNEGVAWADVLENIIKLRDEAIKGGQMIRREYPFFGDFDDVTIPLPPDLARQQQQIEDYWDRRISRATSPRQRMYMSGQKTLELGRWLEPLKVDRVFDAAMKDYQAGKTVIVAAEGINPTAIQGLGHGGNKAHPGFIQEFERKLRDAGIKDWARIHGGKPKAGEVAKLQSNQVKWAIMTPKSGGAGIDLDDALGTHPRVLHIATPNFSGDVFEQMIYRVSRRNTKSPSRIVFHFYGDAFSDLRRMTVAKKKLETLQKIQAGEDIDRAIGLYDEQGNPIDLTERGGPDYPTYRGGAPQRKMSEEGIPEYKGRKVTEIAIDGAALLVDPADYDMWLDMVRFNLGNLNAKKIDKEARKLFQKWQDRTDGNLEQVMDFYKEGKGHLGWYERSKNYIEEHYAEDADIFTQFLAITSAGMNTRTNVTLAKNAYRQWKRGDREFKNFRKAMRLNLQKAARGEPWYDQLYRETRPGQIEPEYRKTGNFYKALRGDPDTVVVDLWVRKAHGYDLNKRLNAADYDFMESNIRRIANEQGVTPRDVQEAIWMGAKLGIEGIRADIRDYGQILRDILGDESGAWRIWVKAVRDGDVKKAKRTLESMLAANMETTEAQLDKASTKYLETGHMKDFRDAVPASLGQISIEEWIKYDPSAGGLVAEIKDKKGKVTLAVRKSGYYATPEFAEAIKDFKDISRTAELLIDPIRLFQTMDQGKFNGPFQRFGAWPARRTEQAKLRFTDKNKRIIDEAIAKYDIHSVKKKKAAYRVAKLIDLKNAWEHDVDSILKLEETKKILSRFNPRVRKNIISFAQEYRKNVSVLISQANAMRVRQGREKIPFRRMYVTKQMKEFTILDRIGAMKTKMEDLFSKPQVVDLTAKPTSPEQAYFPHELPQGLKDYPQEENLVKLWSDYIDAIGRDIFDTNIIQNYKVLAAVARSQGKTNIANAIERHAGEVYGGVTPRFTQFMRDIWGDKPEEYLKWLRKRLNQAVFPLNFAWNVFIQTSSSALTELRYGSINMVKGMEYFTSPKMHRAIKQNAYSSIVKSRWAGGLTYQDVQESITKNRRLQASKFDSAMQWLNIVTSLFEDALTGHAIAAAYHHGKKLGLTGRALWEYASEGGAKTQSMYHYGGVPGLLRDSIIKSLIPFQTFFFEVFNNMREVSPKMVAKLIGRAGAYETVAASSAEGKGLLHRRMWMLARFLAYTTAFNAVSDKAIGRKPWQWYSFIPFAALLGIGYRAFLPFMPVQYAHEFGSGIKDILKYEDFTKLINWMLRYHFPTGMQMARSLRGIEAVIKGRVTDVRGALLYPVHTTEDQIRAVLLGPTRTTKGIEKQIKRRESQELFEYKEVAPGVRVPVKIKKGKKVGTGGGTTKTTRTTTGG